MRKKLGGSAAGHMDAQCVGEHGFESCRIFHFGLSSHANDWSLADHLNVYAHRCIVVYSPKSSSQCWSQDLANCCVELFILGSGIKSLVGEHGIL